MAAEIGRGGLGGWVQVGAGLCSVGLMILGGGWAGIRWDRVGCGGLRSLELITSELRAGGFENLSLSLSLYNIHVHTHTQVVFLSGGPAWRAC